MWPGSERISLPVWASHSLAVLSWLPVRTRVPSGEKATEVIGGRVAAQRERFSTLCIVRGEVPNYGRVVLAAGDHALAVGRELAAEHGPLVALERPNEIAGRAIPNAGRFVAADREHARCVGRKGRGGDPRCVAAEDDVRRFAGLDVPQAGRAVVAGGQQFAAVGRELDRVDVAVCPPSSLRIARPVSASQILAEVIPTAGGDELPSGERAAEATAPCGL